MPIEYVDIETAKNLNNLTMVVVTGVPSPWSESAKGIFHIKKISWNGIRHKPNDPVLQKLTGRDNAPVVIFQDERSRTSWNDILFLSERLVPNPSLLPEDAEDRAAMLGLAHEMMGENGLAWSRRIQIVHIGMLMEGDPGKHAKYIGDKYGYAVEQVENSSDRAISLLNMFSSRLKRQEDSGSPYYFDNKPTAIDIYSATTMALFAPLPDKQCKIHPATRAGFSYLDDATKRALDPILLRHRDMMYKTHLELPLSL